MDRVGQWIATVFEDFYNIGSRVSVVYLLPTVVIAIGIWFWRGRPAPLLGWLIPRKVYWNRSNWVDLQIMLVNSVLSAAGAFSALAFAPLVAAAVMTALLQLTGGGEVPMAAVTNDPVKTVMATIVILLTLDFCTYVEHYLHHESKVLWPFHAVHHSAEVMTPITVNRQHPIYLLIRMPILSLIGGAVQGVMIVIFVGQVSLVTIGTVNIGFVLFNFFGANFRHSHIWISYGPIVEHVLISPAQHHIHHSIDKKHYNKNYGEIFAIWDWMFGTLYIPQGREVIVYGLGDDAGNPIPQPHSTLREAMVQPFVESWANLRASWAPEKSAPDLRRDAQARKPE